MELPEKPRKSRLPAILIGITIISLLIGGIVGYGISSFANSGQISDLQNHVSTLQNQVTSDNSSINSLISQVTQLQNQVTNLSSTQNSSQQIIYENVTYENNTYILGENSSLSQLYEQVKNSVVVVEGIVLEGYDFFGQPVYAEVQGSGFVFNGTGKTVIITNYHVVESAINVTVTFTDGNSYAANETGSDPYADLAVLSTNAPPNEYLPLGITSSSTLKVGDLAIAVGTPLGYTGSMTSGIISALGRTVSVSWSNYDIADCIQMTAPINPGNSGGPLLNYNGEVVGITSYTATYQGVAAQGLGLAIPSSTILREIGSLITNGSYNLHPWLGAIGTDMTFATAQAMNTSVTYGWLITQITSGGPADQAGLKVNDTITAINGTKITGQDDLSTYLEEYTQPDQMINATVVRGNQTISVPVKLGTRPPLSAS